MGHVWTSLIGGKNCHLYLLIIQQLEHFWRFINFLIVFLMLHYGWVEGVGVFECHHTTCTGCLYDGPKLICLSSLPVYASQCTLDYFISCLWYDEGIFSILQVTYHFFHWKKGTPFAEDQGIYNGLTWWEQIDNGKQLTRNRKFLTVVPVVL